MRAAQERAYARIEDITVPNLHYRDDIRERWIEADGDRLQGRGTWDRSISPVLPLASDHGERDGRRSASTPRPRVAHATPGGVSPSALCSSSRRPPIRGTRPPDHRSATVRPENVLYTYIFWRIFIVVRVSDTNGDGDPREGGRPIPAGCTRATVRVHPVRCPPGRRVPRLSQLRELLRGPGDGQRVAAGPDCARPVVGSRRTTLPPAPVTARRPRT